MYATATKLATKKAKSLKEEVEALFEKENKGTIDFGLFKNVEWYIHDNNQVFLIVTESDNFRKLENELEYTSDEFTDEQIDFLNNKVEELAQKMSEYLTSVGVENEIYDNPIGYGQEIDNLVVAFDKSDLSKLK
jgi:hypothetical protein